jgi:acyl-CoA thioester hydrolase
MDAFGHVNNTVFFKLFESARIAYLDRIGFRGVGTAIGPILASTHCRFRRPLVYPETVRVGARVTEIGPDRFTMEYAIMTSGGDVAGEGGGVVVSYDYELGKKAPLPERVREAIRKLDAAARLQA